MRCGVRAPLRLPLSSLPIQLCVSPCVPWLRGCSHVRFPADSGAAPSAVGRCSRRLTALRSNAAPAATREEQAEIELRERRARRGSSGAKGGGGRGVQRRREEQQQRPTPPAPRGTRCEGDAPLRKNNQNSLLRVFAVVCCSAFPRSLSSPPFPSRWILRPRSLSPPPLPLRRTLRELANAPSCHRRQNRLERTA